MLSTPKDAALSSMISASLLSLATVTILSCSRGASHEQVPSIDVTSASFPFGTISMKYACSRENCPCDGQDVSPELSWGSVPEDTQSFALLVTDRDSYFGLGSWFGYFVHWVLYDIPANKRELPEGITKEARLPDSFGQGKNGFDKIGYVGPCPPGHSLHRYSFDLYALDRKLNLPPGASSNDLIRAMKGHVLASGRLMASFQSQKQ